MKQPRSYPLCVITEKGRRALLQGHPWVYEAEVQRLDPCENGGLVDVVSEKGRYLGTGFVSQSSKIRVRLLSSNANDRFDQAFWRPPHPLCLGIPQDGDGPGPGQLPADLWRGRRLPGPDGGQVPGYFSDPDLMPMVWRYGRTWCSPLLRQVLEEDGCPVRGIYERNDVAIRQLEGLEENKGFYPLPGLEAPRQTWTEIEENGVRYRVDYENGQKTGFFLDQKYNRLAVAKLARGKRVLDCFTHTGSFALNAARGGAQHVCAVDISEQAVELARQNARLNGLEGQMEFRAANVFDLLPQLEQAGGHPYDFIILDPPAFTKSRRTVDSAYRGYKEINLRAMKLLPRGGYLATCSCSHFMPEEKFIKMLRAAAQDAQVELKQIEARQQAPDHPILWNVPETNYLKFYLFQVV